MRLSLGGEVALFYLPKMLLPKEKNSSLSSIKESGLASWSYRVNNGYPFR